MIYKTLNIFISFIFFAIEIFPQQMESPSTYEWKPYLTSNAPEYRDTNLVNNKVHSLEDHFPDQPSWTHNRHNSYTKNSSSTNVSSWELLDGLYGGNVRQFYNYGNSLYARTDREIFIYEENSWRSLNIRGLNYDNYFLQYKDDKLFIGSRSFLFSSNNGGEHWNAISIDDGVVIVDLFETQEDEYLLSTSNGIYVSNDDKTEYSLFSLDGLNIYSLNTDDVGNIWACTRNGILKANIDDLVWENVGLDGPYYSKTLFASNGIVYTFDTKRILMSRDGGNIWQEMTMGKYVTDIVFDTSENLIVTTRDQIICVNLLGLVWQSKIFEKFLLTTFVSGSELLIGTLGSGAIKYNSGTEYISDYSRGMNTSTIRGLLVMENGNILACTDADSLYISSDMGTTWESTYGYRSRCMKSSNDGSLYVGANSGIIKSIDFGITWEVLDINVSPFFINAIDISEDNNTIIAGSSTGEVYLSNNAGNNFNKIMDGDYKFVDAIAIIEDDTYILERGHLYYTNNGGSTFTSIQDTVVNKLFVRDILVDRLGYIYLGTSNGLFRSVDGLNWRLLETEFTRVKFLEIDTYGNIFAATSTGTVYISNNHGNDWVPITQRIWGTYFWSFAIAEDNTIFFGSQHKGLYRTKPEIEYNKNEQYFIANNFPNPFNSSTRIEYSLPKESFISIEIFDLLGRKIETLLSETKAAGSYFINWSPKYLSSGVYFCRTDINTKTHVLKMIYLK